MRRISILLCALFLGAGQLFAQIDPVFDPSGKWNVSLQGGALYSINENGFTYRYNDVRYKLITPVGALAVGYDFTPIFGLRGSFSFSDNSGAGNYYNTAAKGFYPYKFYSTSFFADAVFHINGFNLVNEPWQPKIYFGLGYAHTFNYRKPEGYGSKNEGWLEPFHPWQKVHDPSNAFGMRLGFIADYEFRNGIGIFADLCGEAYTDAFNGLRPDKEDQADYEGSAGFPYDLRVVLTFGVSYKFKLR